MLTLEEYTKLSELEYMLENTIITEGNDGDNDGEFSFEDTGEGGTKLSICCEYCDIVVDLADTAIKMWDDININGKGLFDIYNSIKGKKLKALADSKEYVEAFKEFFTKELKGQEKALEKHLAELRKGKQKFPCSVEFNKAQIALPKHDKYKKYIDAYIEFDLKGIIEAEMSAKNLGEFVAYYVKTLIISQVKQWVAGTIELKLNEIKLSLLKGKKSFGIKVGKKLLSPEYVETAVKYLMSAFGFEADEKALKDAKQSFEKQSKDEIEKHKSESEE